MHGTVLGSLSARVTKRYPLLVAGKLNKLPKLVLGEHKGKIISNPTKSITVLADT